MYYLVRIKRYYDGFPNNEYSWMLFHPCFVSLSSAFQAPNGDNTDSIFPTIRILVGCRQNHSESRFLHFRRIDGFCQGSQGFNAFPDELLSSQFDLNQAV
jgi:hypothetical protein